jgi:hypothetical protein
LAFTAGLAVLILLVYFPNGEGAMGNLAHMAWVFLAAVLTGVSMLREDPLRLRFWRPTPTDTNGAAVDIQDDVPLTELPEPVADPVAEAATKA